MAAKQASSSVLRSMAVGWGAFTGSHLLCSHSPVRDALIQQLGDENKFRGMYSLLALASFAPTTYLYLRYGRGSGVIPHWTAATQSNPLVRGTGLGLKLAAAVGFGQALATPNLIAEGKKQEDNEVEVKGIFRITRHALFTSLALLGLGNIFLRGYAGDVIYWAGYPLIWVVGCPHQDMRQKAVLPKEFFDKTSFLPFQAIMEGRNSLKEAFKEFNKPVLITSIVVPIFFL